MAKRLPPEWWAEQRPEVVGKTTEKLVISVLEGLNSRQDFAYHRLSDAKAARGAIAAQPADFIIADGKKGLFLEVKSIKHPYRLTRDGVRQLPLMKKFELAGMPSLILVHHYLEGVWRVVTPDQLEPGKPSWDLGFAYAYPSLEDITDQLFGDRDAEDKGVLR